MQNAYQLQGPIAQRGGQTFGLAAQSSMIDPGLGNHPYSLSQMSQAYVQQSNQSTNAMEIQNDRDSPDSTSGRSLPATDVTNETLDDAYVEFILYCNPSISDDVDTSDLRKGFRAPPRSDGKFFDPFILFGLISRLEDKNIKTWTDLVVELGVELPDASKNQSTQKVQQYAVRLKRWLRAFHIDAFFHYCLGKASSYYTNIPPKDAPLEGAERDGVSTEEDLALRALLPQWRPKRGRRKAEDADVEQNDNASKRLQHRRANSTDFFPEFDGQFAHPTPPQSGAPWSAQPRPHTQDLWSAAQVAIVPKTPSTGRTPVSSQLSTDSAGQLLHWRQNDTPTPASPYPQSALATRATYPLTPSGEDPKSACPLPGKSPLRSRKRHGPAVSSAWQGGSSTPSGKLRGRPPSNRSVQDGPFSTFPANPSTAETPTINFSSPSQATSPHPGAGRNSHSQNQHASNIQYLAADQSQAAGRKPSKLQLQVPEHAGGPVRLATPPTVLINGESGQQSNSSHERRSSADFFSSFDSASEGEAQDEMIADESGNNIDWRRRCMVLKRKLQEKEDELKAMKRRVLDAVM